MLKIKEVNYHQLNVQQRVNLTVAALSRGDGVEARRLFKTCPKRHYLAIDDDFIRQVDAITWVAEKYVDLCQYYFAKCQLAEGAITILTLGDKELIKRRPQYTVAGMEEALFEYISTLKAVHLALVEFCEGVGIDSQKIVKWMAPVDGWDRVGEYLDFKGVEPDREFARHIRNKFRAYWEGSGALK